MPIITGQVVVFKCPQCGRREFYTVRREDIDEALSYEISRIGFFHGDHILLCGLNRLGEPVTRGIDSPNKRDLYSSNRIYAEGFLLVCTESPLGNFQIALVDTDQKVLDLRCFAGDPSSILSIFWREIDSILRECSLRGYFIIPMGANLIKMKINHLVAFIKIIEGRNLDKSIEFLSSILERDVDAIISAVNSIDKSLRDSYKSLPELIWYILLLKNVFPMNPPVVTLSRVMHYIENRRTNVPNKADVENIELILRADETLVSICSKSELIQLSKPVAILLGHAEFVDLIYDNRGKEVSLETLLRSIKCEHVGPFLDFLRELEKRKLVGISPKKL
ncbi:MAG: hypothetical protein NDP13_05255 [Crenarchaeota archaeon]|nr:hypothetical protein [Thermoproteota archaeon]